MQIVKETWAIEELIKKRNDIDPKPQYQRTAVWTLDRKAHLIDSILRDYDLPKFYFTFHKPRNGKGFEFEVADGQQRIRAIWEFRDDKYSIKKGTTIEGVDLSSLKYSELPLKFKKRFDDYEINISNIISNDYGEVNELFTRLQKGVNLNPPELRHAMLSNLGAHIDKYVVSQQSIFFDMDSKIPDTRFKHQEYIDHVIALVHYKNSKDLKAATMAQVYIDFSDKDPSTFIPYFDKTTIVLKKMKEINSFKKGIFKNKWSFVDAFWFLYRNIGKLEPIDDAKFCKLLVEFDQQRMKYNAKPERILNLKKHKFGKPLFDYIQAFNKEGANKENIKIRAEVYDTIFDHILS